MHIRPKTKIVVIDSGAKRISSDQNHPDSNHHHCCSCHLGVIIAHSSGDISSKWLPPFGSCWRKLVGSDDESPPSASPRNTMLHMNLTPRIAWFVPPSKGTAQSWKV